MNNNKQEILNRVEFYVELENYGEALMLLRQLEEQDPQDLDILCKLASCLIQIGEIEEAREYQEKAEKIDPNNIKVKLVKERLDEFGPSDTPQVSILKTPHFDYKEKKKTKAIKKKECPNCGNKVEKSSKICGHCGHHFRKDIFKQIVIIVGLFLVIAYTISIPFRYLFQGPNEEAEIVNKAGDVAQKIELQNIDWKCYGGLSLRYRAEVKADLKNVSSHPLKKVNISIHLWGKEVESTFVWIEFFNLKPKQVIKFNFPYVISPYYAYRCEFRINEVVLPQEGEDIADKPIDIYVPNSGTFPTFTFTTANGEIIKEKERFTARLQEEFTMSDFLWNLLLFLRSLLFSFLAIFTAAKLVDWVETNPHMVDDTKTQILSAAAFAIAMVVVNWLSSFLMPLMPFMFRFLLGIFSFILKIFLFFFFFKKELFQTIILIIFYFCGVIFLESFTQWLYKLITGGLQFTF